MDLIIKQPAGAVPVAEDKFWAKWGAETRKLYLKYGHNIRAERVRRSDGTGTEWKITAPYQAERAFRDLASEAARHIGFKGGDHGAVQFWLDHMFGDHMLKSSPRLRRDDERVAKVTRSDGSIEMYRGRQRLG